MTSRPLRTRLIGAALTSLVSAALLTIPAGATAAAAPAELCGRQIAPVAGGYEVGANIWNSRGELCITTNGDAAFTVTKSTIAHSNTVDPNRGPGAYPYIGTTDADKRFPLPVAGIGDTTTSWSTVSPDSGSYNAAYDIWYAPTADDCPGVITAPTSTEVMVWLKSPNLDPPESWRIASGVKLSGIAFDVFQFTGPTGQRAMIYSAVTPVDQVKDLQLGPITQDSVNRGKIAASGVLCRVQAGFEIHDQAPQLKVTGFSVDVSGKPATSPSPQPTATTSPSTAPTPSATATSGTTPAPTTSPTQPAPSPTATAAPQPTPKPNPGSKITNGVAKMCLDNRHAKKTAGNPVVSYRCNGTSAQRWIYSTTGTVMLAASPKLCLRAAKAKKGAKVALAACGTAKALKWKTGKKHKVTGPAGLCLDAPKAKRGAKAAHGVQLILWPCHGKKNQQWVMPKKTKPAAVTAPPQAPSGPVSPSPTATMTAVPSGGTDNPPSSTPVLFGDAFSGPNRLVTNAYAHWNSQDTSSVRSKDWEVTSGSFFVRDGVGWSRKPDSAEPNATSETAPAPVSSA